MNRIAIALLALLIASPAYAQDWERVFSTVPAPEPTDKVLVLDPDEPRDSRDRYKLVEVPDMLPAAARLVYVATARQEYTDGAGTNPDLRILIDGLTEFNLPTGSLVLFTGPLFPPSAGAVEVLLGTEPAAPLRNRSGDTVSWSDLITRDIHIAIRLAEAWNLIY